MGKYQAYPEYKDSGVEWLGNIPDDWEILDGKRMFKNIRIPAFADDKQLAASQKYGVIPQDLMMQLNDSKVMLALKGTDSFKHVDSDDFVISLRSFEGGIEHSKYAGCVSPAYTVLRASRTLVPSYYRYLFKSKPYISALQSSTDSLRDGKSITYDQFGLIKLVIPSIDEQQKIAAFLNHETAKIDALIEKQQQLIQLLKEKRQAVISHAVTKGLNPNAPMKDSGIEWLGEVPAHWDLKKIAHIAVLKSGESIVSEQIEAEGEYPVFGGNGLRGFTSSYTNEGAYVLIGRQGALCGNINYSSGKFWASEHAVVVYPMIPVNVLWLGEVLRSMNLNQYNVSAAQPGLAISNIVCLKIPFPGCDEQDQIAIRISNSVKKIESLISKSEEAIQLMQERRTALISAAVTGKIDVRNFSEPATR